MVAVTRLVARSITDTGPSTPLVTRRGCRPGSPPLRTSIQWRWWVATIAASEAARTGWLGDPADFDFRADLETIAATLRRAEKIRTVTADASSIRDFNQADKQMLRDAELEIARLQSSVKQRVELIGKCAQQAADIDRALREERESDVMAKRREDLRGRLGPILYGSQKLPIDSPSESGDVVTARAAAFHELKALVDKHRLAATGD